MDMGFYIIQNVQAHGKFYIDDRFERELITEFNKWGIKFEDITVHSKIWKQMPYFENTHSPLVLYDHEGPSRDQLKEIIMIR